MTETVGELQRQAVLDRRRYDRDLALITMAMGEMVETMTGQDPLADLRDRLRQWSRESDRGLELSGAVTAARQRVERVSGQRANRRSGPLPSRERRERLREERRRQVRDGENIFIDSDDERALASGQTPAPAPVERAPTPGPSRLPDARPSPWAGRDVPREHCLIPVEWPDENEESGFRVVPTYDLTFDED